MTPDTFFKQLWRSDVVFPNRLRVPDDHVLDPVGGREPFRRDQHYFAVKVDEIRLASGREWLTTFDPMLLAVTEFGYANAPASVPFVIGPTLLRQKDVQVPGSMVYASTKVAGVHPYAGGAVSVALVLYRVKRDNYLARLLRVVEKASAALDPSTLLSQYVKLGGVIADGIDALLGLDGTSPVLGMRVEFDPNTGDDFRPGHYALVSGATLRAEDVWVRGSELLHGARGDAATPIVGEDQILYSITQVAERNDVPSLPWFRPLWEQIDQAANTGQEKNWEVARGYLGVLYEKLRHSPDVTTAQGKAVYHEFAALAKETYEDAKARTTYAPGDASDDVLGELAELFAR